MAPIEQQLADAMAANRPRLVVAACRIVGVEDCEDAVQDAYLRAWKRRQQYRASGPVSGWLWRIVRNTALMRLRAERVEPASGAAESPLELACPTDTPEQAAIKVELSRLLRGSLRHLPRCQRAAVEVSLSYPDAVQTPDRKTSYFRARHRLAALPLVQQLARAAHA